MTSLQTLTALNRSTVDDKLENRRLIILAPRLRNRNALLGWFLNADTDISFYALTPNDTTLLPFLHNLISALQDGDPKFGRDTTQALNDKQAKPIDLADALIADVGRAKPKPRYLILDNFDMLTMTSDEDRFFERFISKIPHGLQVVINSRQLNYLPWWKFVQSGEAIVLGSENVLDGGILNPNNPESAHLEVYGFGGGRVFVNGTQIDSWDGPLPRNLFYYFVDHPMVTRDEIFETFWPDLPTKEATNVFHVTKRKISERLGYELTGYSGGFYRPSGQMNIHYDVMRFEEAVHESRESRQPTTPDDWYRAIRLYRSEFLHNFDMPWINQRREQLRLVYAEALIGLGRLYKATNDSDQAISFYLRALREIPEREDLHRDVMSLYEMRGEREKAVEQYKILSATLKRTLNITPSKVTRTLYAMITGEGA